MLQAMFSGVSGLQVHQVKLDVIGNNIANVNTVGFKAGRVTFEDQLSQTLKGASRPSGDVGGENPSQVGLGVVLGAVDTVQSQGNLQTTGKPTDLAVEGNGFFQVASGGNVYYTRDGSFDLDSDGILVNPSTGVKLLGYVADADGKIDTSKQITPDSVLKIPVGLLTSVKVTTASTFQGNLDAGASLESTKVTVGGQLDVSQATGTLSATLYDSAGSPHIAQISLANPVHAPAAGAGIPAGATQRWDVNVTLDGNSVTPQKLYAIPDGTGGSKFVFTDTNNPANSLGSILSLNVPGAKSLNLLSAKGAAGFPVSIDFGGLQAKSVVTNSANGQGGVTPIQSTEVLLKGNVNLDGSTPIVNTSNIYKADGTAFTVTTTLSNPQFTPAALANVPAGAKQQWDMKVEINTVPPTGATTVYDSSVVANGQSKVYFVPGSGFVTADGNNPAASLGSTIQLTGNTIPPVNFNQGLQTATGFPLTIDISALTTTTAASVADGQTGASPTWNSSVTVYDSLGVSHLLNFAFQRNLVGTGAPSNAAARWDWTAKENGQPVADSATTGNSALFFDSKGQLINQKLQGINLAPKNGSAAQPISMDFSTLTQLSGTSSVAVTSQDGFPVGSLQTYAISQEGLITGVFSNGQTRTLGQVSIADFSNPAGLEKLGQNLFKGSSNSGLAQAGIPGTAGRGKINTGFVEMSNVDLSTEFTNLIITQRGFQANTRIISVVDSMLQDIINLKQ